MVRASRKDIEAARTLVRARDGHRCQRCGCSIVDVPSSVHHRKLKGLGGSALLETAENLIRMCGTGTTGCHGWAHANPELARAFGWIVGRFLNPADVPVKTFHGWMALDATGGKAPAEAIA
jgi:hypothetical protein